MPIQLADATVIVNNAAVPIVPNSLSYTEGFGEQKIMAASVGGGESEQVFVNDIESQFSTVKFAVYVTKDNIKNARTWKSNGNQNAVQIAGSNADGEVTRTFSQAALLNDYEVPIGVDSQIELEFTANKSI